MRPGERRWSRQAQAPDLQSLALHHAVEGSWTVMQRIATPRSPAIRQTKSQRSEAGRDRVSGRMAGLNDQVERRGAPQGMQNRPLRTWISWTG